MLELKETWEECTLNPTNTEVPSPFSAVSTFRGFSPLRSISLEAFMDHSRNKQLESFKLGTILSSMIKWLHSAQSHQGCDSSFCPASPCCGCSPQLCEASSACVQITPILPRDATFTSRLLSMCYNCPVLLSVIVIILLLCVAYKCNFIIGVYRGKDRMYRVQC